MAETTSEFFIDKEHIDPKRDEDYLIFKLGYLHPVVDGRRTVNLLWGGQGSGSTSFPATITSDTINADNGTVHTHELGYVDVAKIVSGTTIKYGALYNWFAANDSRHITNTGWHLGNLSDYQALWTYLGGSSVAGGHLKEAGTTFWNSPNTGADNSSGFNARGSGSRNYSTGIFQDLNLTGWLHTSAYTGGSFNVFILRHNSAGIGWGFSGNELKSEGISVRPIKDSTTLTNGQRGTYTGNNGKVYTTICIGTQEWVDELINETKFRNGDWIHGYDNGIYTPISNEVWGGLLTEGMCYYNDDETNGGGQTPFTYTTHSPVTIDPASATILSINENQVLSITLNENNTMNENIIRYYGIPPNGAINGINNRFIISASIEPNELVFLNGQLLVANQDYTITYGSTAVIIMTALLEEGETLFVDYSIRMVEGRVYNCIPAGIINGFNTVYTIQGDMEETEEVYRNGKLLVLTTDYSITYGDITTIILTDPLLGVAEDLPSEILVVHYTPKINVTTRVYNQIPTGGINNENDTYTINHLISNETLFLNGLRLVRDVDYIITYGSTTVIIMVTPLGTGNGVDISADKLIIHYSL